jgi:hypothetical protein
VEQTFVSVLRPRAWAFLPTERAQDRRQFRPDAIRNCDRNLTKWVSGIHRQVRQDAEIAKQKSGFRFSWRSRRLDVLGDKSWDVDSLKSQGHDEAKPFSGRGPKPAWRLSA